MRILLRGLATLILAIPALIVFLIVFAVSARQMSPTAESPDSHPLEGGDRGLPPGA